MIFKTVATKKEYMDTYNLQMEIALLLAQWLILIDFSATVEMTKGLIKGVIKVSLLTTYLFSNFFEFIIFLNFDIVSYFVLRASDLTTFGGLLVLCKPKPEDVIQGTLDQIPSWTSDFIGDEDLVVWLSLVASLISHNDFQMVGSGRI